MGDVRTVHNVSCGFIYFVFASIRSGGWWVFGCLLNVSWIIHCRIHSLCYYQ